MKIREGLVFTLPIEPHEVIGKECKLTIYRYNIGERKYAVVNIYPLKLKVIKVNKSTVECNIIEDENNTPFKENIPIQFEEIAKMVLLSQRKRKKWLITLTITLG